ncbi:MAG: choice-of-anchor Q domain-containing protein [Planctomycetota bacterium]|jgi:probable HAF family extracellular repeat protein
MKVKRFLILAIGLLLSHFVSVLFADKPSFQGIGNLQGTSDGRMAISADGLTAVGYRQLESDSYEAFKWTVQSGIIGLGYLPGGNLSTAASVSADGSVVVGYSKSSLGGQAFRWTEAEGMVGLYDLPGGRFYSTAYDVSADGSIVVGFSDSESAVDYEAFRWTVSNGMIGLGDLPGGEYESRAYAVSADGLVVVGYSKSDSGEQAFRWTESEGMSGLGLLWLGGFSQAYGISPDGSVVVGRASVSKGAVAFRWTDAEGMVSLGDLPGGSVSGTAYDASTNGSIIVGMSNSFNDFEAFIWDEDNGIRSLHDLLINNYHLDLTGWHLRCAYGISDDGTVIVGSGNNPQGQREGWIAVLTELKPAIIYVDDDAAGANDGSSWADAFNYLQDALTAAWSGDEIRVAQGIYKPDQGSVVTPGDREATFQLINGVTIKGGYAGYGEPDPNARDIDVYETILSGDLAGYDGPDFANNTENNYHVVTGSGTSELAVLDGFTITAGNANAAYRSPHGEGGGMYNNDGSPTVNNCKFTNNSARYGGGMYNYKSSPSLTNCTFNQNSAGRAGGMFNCCQSNPTLTSCIFIRNSANQGGGMENEKSAPTLTNCSFRGNRGFSTCGSMTNLSLTNATLTNCIFSENSASKYAGIFNANSNLTMTNCSFIGNTAERHSGGMYNLGSTLILSQCLFSGNSSSGSCGAILTRGSYHRQSHITLTNCTFFGNSGIDGNSLVFDSHSSCPPSIVQLTNCILWDGENPIWNNDASKISITYSNVQCGWPGEGNIDADPCFVELGFWDADSVWVEGDYHLLPDSSCIDAGDPNYIAGPNETDLDGRPRIIGGRIDMGAYETPIPAEARILPRTINLASKGKSITCYIWLFDGYDVADIDPGSVLLEGQINAEQFSVDEHKQVATASFDREKVQSILNVGDIELTITCRLTDGTYFEATDIIQVTDKGPK